MLRFKSDKGKLLSAALSGILLTAAFPKIGWDLLIWVALVPLLFALRDGGARQSFRIGYIAGLVHYLTLLYWVVYTMRTYGHLPWYLCLPVLFLFAAVLALFTATFCLALSSIASKPVGCLTVIPVLWVALEYVRSFFLSGFPWELIGYAPFKRLHVIQISDIFGVYGVSFLIAGTNAALFLALLAASGEKWHQSGISKMQAGAALGALAVALGLTGLYGTWRIRQIDRQAVAAAALRTTVVQGNIEQSHKWDPAFQAATIEKYNRLSLAAAKQHPRLVVWPESAAPFYFLFEKGPTAMVLAGIRRAHTTFLIGSPSFVRRNQAVQYYNSAFLMGPGGRLLGRYDKAHLVPFGEYVPFKKWLPFLGKIVEQVGDFWPGQKGQTIDFAGRRLGVLICYEIIFPELARIEVKNGAALLVNLTNDAWYGRSAAPYQHFSMVVFRAVENRRALARAANTGISGFIDPVGRVLAASSLFTATAMTRDLPVLREKTVYTRVGDLFAQACLAAALLLLAGGVMRLSRLKKTTAGRH